MFIKITAGTYGHREGSGGRVTIVPKTSNDPPFEVDETQGNRLLKLGVAERIEAPIVLPSEKMTRDQLIVLAQELGIEIPPGANKKQLVAMIAAKNEELPDDDVLIDDDDDGDGDSGGETPPIFDPAAPVFS